VTNRPAAPTLLLLIAAPLFSTVVAQGGVVSTPVSHNFAFGADLVMSHPRGEFSRNAGPGFGFGGHALVATDKWGITGLRVDGGLISYGRERHRYSCGIFCRYNATTSNDIVNFQVGGQLVMPRKSIAPYVGLSYGVLWFNTHSEVETAEGTASPFEHNAKHSDVTGSYVFSGGLYVPLKGVLGGLTAVAGARLFTGGYAEYLTPESLQCNSTTCTLASPFKSRTESLVIHVGASSSMGFRKSRPSVRE